MKESAEYNSLTDEELIDRQRNGEEQIADYICDKYKNLVRSKAKSMFILGADREDLIQEGMIGLFKAVRDYDSGRDASFFTFAELCISRQMYTAVQASQCKKHIPLNTYVSLYSEEDDASGAVFTLDRYVGAKGNVSPEDEVLDKESTLDLQKRIEAELSSFENQVLDLYLTGMKTTQIAKVLGRDEKSTDNGLQRLKAKIRKLLSDKK